MSAGFNQKLKLLYILDFLRENSNYEHPVSRAAIEKYLADNEINAERKAIYTDIEALNNYGACIELKKGKNGGYYCDSSEFDLPEIKMLVDSVQSSKFITEKQSENLIKKLENLTNKYDARQLHRQVVVQDRVKTKQTNIFANIDRISYAIDEDKKIKFKYLQYNLQKKLEPRHDGKDYVISPIFLLCDNENYYLVAYDSDREKILHFRVDKMKSISTVDEKRDGTNIIKKSDISSYNKKVFSMYHGNEEKVTIKFSKALIGVVIDRFGSDLIIIPSDDGETFTTTINIEVSNQFYGWICSFPGEAEILAPESAREELKKIGKNLAKLYK